MEQGQGLTDRVGLGLGEARSGVVVSWTTVYAEARGPGF